MKIATLLGAAVAGLTLSLAAGADAQPQAPGNICVLSGVVAGGGGGILGGILPVHCRPISHP